MTEIVTDTKTIVINMLMHGDLEISGVITPTEIEVGVPFTITYSVKNVGNSDTCYGKLINTVNKLILDQWQQVLAPNATKTITINFPNGITSTLNAKIDVGYIISSPG